ncbi:Arv1-like family-domain-containing protein [Radiomyces spectabilis]|uniref:Arv1-like family-domain-containing protein n=1 Tax=Radiomyces spectabilis TaxID=64574 RepID=UPI0022210615|nr:Arv1-like family-domain-containing protein [Radiomyces spectabilis]KAI8391040.1 Arv1-like family-domain-containing protein [Radiomyces spectabilis]
MTVHMQDDFQWLNLKPSHFHSSFVQLINMPTCVECGASVQHLYTQYSKDNIRLTSCERCHKFADKYIEHDLVIIFIDLLLHKSQVYRHLLFNRIFEKGNGIEPHVSRFAILLILFEVYIKWVRLEQYYTDQDSLFIQQSLYYQYLYILTLCILGTLKSRNRPGHPILMKNPRVEFILFHCVVCLTIRCCLRHRDNIRYNYVSMALIISSFGKMLLILMVIWDYKQLEYSWLVSIIVLASNVEALSVYLNLSYIRTLMILVVGTAGRLLAQIIFLSTTYIDAGIGSSTYAKSTWLSL